jgi:DNA-binding CsgD family transcriptional regulator
MDPDRISQLTEQQRLCLQLVYSHLTSKEIAWHLGMEPVSIDQDIKAAVRVLGARDRRDAAQILAEHEKSDGLQPSVHQALGINAVPRARKSKLLLPIGGVAPENLGWRMRLAWIAAIAIGIAITISALVSTLEVLTRLVRD